MASGLVALLDDVAAIAKVAATSLDDVTAAAGKAGTKAVGAVVDDAAVTPSYAMGFTPDRELPIVWKIAVGSLRNKFLFLVPGALALSAFAPWAVTPILVLGGTYLCFEAGEKILEAILHEDHADEAGELALGSAELERQKVSGAIRTDLILSAEIVAISLSSVTDRPLLVQAGALALVGLLMTVGVYGAVALIVKMDDIGLHMARRPAAAARRVGRALVKAMPMVLSALSGIGTVAMLWVGGGILLHALEHYHAPVIPDLAHAMATALGDVAHVGGLLAWTATALYASALGLVLGGVLAGGLHLARHRR
ncbi:MAG: DUF808 family protein [Phenylobacterium sp.]|uniref:DUF808 domain-containing protein n=1 Tax=Phenylobacterium sp. TaxID=1871053 RepID=UPI0025DA6223|nr:DUF808 domain-containing protein [Phenylobacterium sp.]MBI1197585.1 DUF808 family protein [Phenylobacterium sp.]